MDPMILMLAGIIALVILLMVIGGIFVLLRRRAAAKSAEAEKSKTRTKRRRSRKTGSQPTAAESTKPENASSNNNNKPPDRLKPATSPASLSGDASTTMPAKSTSAATDQAKSSAVRRSQPASRELTGEEIRILIVDDNTGTRENVSRLLYFEDDLEVIGQAINGRQGVEMALELKPHIVLMDINMPDMDGITATQEMGTKAPFSQVIIMSVQSDQHYMKRAMAAGARDFQPKPFTSDELVNCIRRVYSIGLPTYRHLEALETTQTQQKARPTETNEPSKEIDHPVIAVFSPKGGVGTSAIAANLAVSLHQARGDVVLMDGDLQFGDVLVHLNTRPARTISDLIQQDQFEVDLVTDIVLPHDSGLKLLLAPPEPALADIITPRVVAEIIKYLKQKFKMVVVDTNSALKDLTLTILEEADYIVVVITPELPAVKSAKLFLEVMEQLEFDLDQILVVVNQADKPGGVRLDKIEQVLKLDHIYQIPFDSKLHFALSKGQAICLTDSGAPSAKAIVNLAQELLEMLPAKEALEEPI